MVTGIQAANRLASLLNNPCPGQSSATCSGGGFGSGAGVSSSGCSCCIDVDGYFSDKLGNEVSVADPSTAIVPIRPCEVFKNPTPFSPVVSVKGFTFPCDNTCEIGSLCSTFPLSGGQTTYSCCKDSNNNPCVPGCLGIQLGTRCTLSPITDWSDACGTPATEAGIKCMTNTGEKQCCKMHLCSAVNTVPNPMFSVSGELCAAIVGQYCAMNADGSDL